MDGNLSLFLAFVENYFRNVWKNPFSSLSWDYGSLAQSGRLLNNRKRFTCRWRIFLSFSFCMFKREEKIREFFLINIQISFLLLTAAWWTLGCTTVVMVKMKINILRRLNIIFQIHAQMAVTCFKWEKH
jgi:hypothetical protein